MNLPKSLLPAMAVIALLSGCGPKPDERPTATPPPSIADRVRVLNGDVLVIDDQHIRLAGVYAPQGPPDARCWAEALAAKQETEALRRMINSGHTISYTATGARDLFNRQYAKVLLNGVDLGQTLYDDGLVAKTEGAFGWCEPISRGEAGAPPLLRVMDMGG